MSWFATNLISSLLLPPLNLLLILLLGIALLYRRPKLACGLIIASFALLWLASTPYIAEGELHLLEAQTSPLKNQDAAAIVILGGGTYFNAPEYAGQDTVSAVVLPRLRYGARLQRTFKLPILVTGGKPLGNSTSEAQQMRSALEQDFQVQVQWTEDASDNTLENARNSYQMLQKSGIRKIYLVTHAWHMPRSAAVFRRAGFEVVEAPTAFTTRYQTDLLAFVPHTAALNDSRIFFHEAIGLLWYQAKSRLHT
ncbi:MAG: YdcF family protein [Gallionella sp.]|jgi:uncharacterized SAM-binding protein YcdF (DUF218 family)